MYELLNDKHCEEWIQFKYAAAKFFSQIYIYKFPNLNFWEQKLNQVILMCQNYLEI